MSSCASPLVLCRLPFAACSLPFAVCSLPFAGLTGRLGWSVGIAGGAEPGAFADNGATVAEIYDPTKPVGSRRTTLADSQIWRLYHSTAVLTKNGEVYLSVSQPSFGEFITSTCRMQHMYHKYVLLWFLSITSSYQNCCMTNKHACLTAALEK